MQTSALATRIRNAAHAAHSQVALQPGALVVEDAAPFYFARASSGGLTVAYDFATVVASNGNLVRARTIAGNILKVHVATPGDTLTWVEKLSIANVPTGQGIALFVNGADIYLFHIASDNRTIQYRLSQNSGETWDGTSTTVYQLPAQVSGTFIRLAASSVAHLFVTSTQLVSNAARSALGFVYLFDDSWQYWDLGWCDLGFANTVLSDGSSAPFNSLGALYNSATGEHVVTFYANQLRGDLGAGIYAVRVSQITSTTALWSNEEPVYVAQPVADGNGALKQPVTFAMPKLCKVGSEYWCIALESSKHAGHNVDHLAYFRSLDGLNWSDRNEYLAGSDLEYLLGGLPSDYLLRDFLFGQVLVSGTRVFLVGYDMAFVASANSKVGVDENTNLLPNGSFEGTFAGGLASSWSAYSTGTAAGTRAESADAFAGAKAQRLTKTDGGADRWGIVSNTAEVRSGLFELACYVKILSYTPGAQIYLYTDFSGGPYAQGQLYPIQATDVGKWVRLAKSGATADPSDLCFFYVWIQTANADILVDAAQVRPLLSNQLDISPDVKRWLFTLASAGEASSLSASDIPDSTGALSAAMATLLRAGARLTLKAGYYTSAGLEELLQIATVWIDRVESTLAQNMTKVSITARDGVKLLTRWVADAFHSFLGSEYVGAENMGGLANAMTVANGNFIQISNELWSAPIELDSALVDNVSVFAIPASRDGFIEIKWRCISTSSSWGAQYGGVVLQFKSHTDYYALVFNASGVVLLKSKPGQYGKLVAYDTLATNTLTPTPNTTFYLLAQQWHNKLYSYYSIDRKTWYPALSYTGLPTDRAQWGIIGTGNLTPITPIGWAGRASWRNLTNDYPNKTRRDWCARIQVDKLCYLRSITIYVGRMTKTEPSLIVGLLKSNATGTNPADATVPENIVWQTLVDSTDLPSSVNGVAGQSPTTIPVDSLIQLQPGVYWLWHAANGTLQNDPPEYYDFFGTQLDWNDARRLQHILQVSENNGATWNTWAQDGGFVMAGTLSVDVESNGVIFSDVKLATGDLPRSLEDLTRAVVAKAGVLNCAFENKFYDDCASGLDTGAEATAHKWKTPTAGTWANPGGIITGYHASASSYAILKSNGYQGTWGDGLCLVRMRLTSATAKAGICLRLVNDDPTTLYGYIIELDPTAGAQRINLYRCLNTAIAVGQLVNSIPPLVTIPTITWFELKVIQIASAFKIFINDCLAGVVSYSSGAATPSLALGSFGLMVKGNVSGGATCEFFAPRVPDLNQAREDFHIESGETARAALDRLLGDDRVKYFFRGDGSFVAGTFANRAISDTYAGDYKIISRSVEDRDTASQIRPRGRNFADRYSPALLQRWGRRLRIEDCGDAVTDEQAYENAATYLRTMEEQAAGASLESEAVLVTEVEDAIQVESDQYVVDSGSIEFAIASGSVSLRQALNLRAKV